MNHRNFRILTALSLAVLWLAAAAHAQYAATVVKVTIPFDFTVNRKAFPSGEYWFRCTPGRLDLRDSRAHVVASLFPHPVESLENAPRTKLQFSTDDSHALLRLWVNGQRIGYELDHPKAATALAKQRSNPPAQISGGGNIP